jgi:GTP-binding protein HflX
VAAFKATLEELGEADLLLHVVDVSHPRVREQMAAVDEVLAELGLATKPSLTVVNKVDRSPNAASFGR